MEALKWHFTEVVTPPFDKILMQRVLVITDSAQTQAAAQRVGIKSLHLDLGLDKATVQAALMRSGNSHDIIVVAFKCFRPVLTFAQEKWRVYSQRCLDLLHWVFAQNRQIHLLLFHSRQDVLAALFEGLARSACLEMPQVAFTSVQVPSDLLENRLGEWISAASSWPSARLRFNDSGMSRQMLTAMPPIAETAPLLQIDDNVIVIGGAGGIGIELCRFLQTVTNCRSKIFVLGRKTPDAKLKCILKDRGVKSYFRVDATDIHALESVFSHIYQQFGPIKAVFNLAGVLDDGLFHNLTADRLENVLRPKVSIALNLAALAQEYCPQYIVNFSSLTATIGHVGQCSYAAANTFVDRISEYLPGWYSFAWGLWDTQGMQMKMEQSGLRAMSPKAACECMMSALANGHRHLVIYDGEINGVTALRSDIVVPDSQIIPPISFVTPFNGDVDVLRKLTRQWLKEIICRHTGLKTVLDTDNLLDKGIDSVGSIQISADIASQLSMQKELKLSRAILFTYPSITQLADHLIEQAASLLHTHLSRTAMTGNISSKSLQSQDNAVAFSIETQVLKPDSNKLTVLPEVVLHQSESTYRDGDIAIIGVAGEFPNGNTLETFWTSLQKGEDCVTVIPEQRWNWRCDYAPAIAGDFDKTYGRHGGFIDGAYEFDPVFFNIAPVDAELMDPQERRFLQVSYHALEDAGYFIAPIRKVGVFAAAMFGHYQDLNKSGRVISSSFAAIANRVSYALDLQGPSLTLDTMCSGSLTALHMACNSLRLGECGIALAGGVNIMSHPGKYRLLSQGKFLSISGHCHAFGVEADGYVPGEGAAAVILKPLADAIRDQDHVYAIIRATAINASGKTSGFTVPSVQAQQSVIQTALSRAGVSREAINYVEAHGTGTSLGDPIELQALQMVYGENTDAPCYLGSIKSNIGHLESAAAMAGLFKIIQQFAHEQLVPTLHCTLENPYLNIEQTRFRLVREKQYWPLAAASTRFAGLSSFGAGGANGHAILQQYIPPCAGTTEIPVQEDYLIPLSASNRSGLQRVKQQLADYITTNPDICLYALSYTLCCAKQHHSERICYIIRDVAELLAGLADGNGSVSGNASIGASVRSDSIHIKQARAYLQGNADSFADMFATKKLIHFPHYPFARDLYRTAYLQYDDCELTGPASQAGTVEKTGVTGSTSPVLLEPVWHRNEQILSEKRPSLVVMMARPEQKLPTCIGGTKILRIYPGRYLQITDDSIQLRPENEADLAQALNYITENLNQERIYWINLNVNWTPASALALAKVMQAHQRPCVLLCVNDEHQISENIAMCSVFRVLALENDFIACSQVQIEGDIVSGVAAVNWEQMLIELSNTGQDFKDIKWQDNQRWEKGLALLELTEEARLRSGGVYLIAGGMGMIGKEIARHLYDRYNAKVILIGRSSLTPKKQAWLQQLQQMKENGEICYRQADITDSTETEYLIKDVLHQFGYINGIIQSAGVIHDNRLQNKSLADFKSVMSGKVQGTRNLDHCTAGLDLDFFCLFSSMSSITGNIGQSDYVAANRFLDEFAIQRNRQVKKKERQGHTLSINWPLWLDDQENRQYQSLGDYLYRHYGFAPLTLSQGAELFINWINGVPQHCSEIMGLIGEREKIIAHFLPSVPNLTPQANVSSVVPMAQHAASEVQFCHGLIHLTQSLTQLSQEDISLDKSWNDLGFNSVMIQIMARMISEKYGVQIPPNALFTYGNIRHMAEYLEQQGAVRNQPETAIEAFPAEIIRVKDAETKAAVGDSAENRFREKHRFAIVGISGIMPGAADMAAFWQLLKQNRSAIQRVERWQDKTYYAGTIENIDKFDARFFGLSNREAMLMDPQHRLFLQTSYNALADAGYAPSALTDVGIFAGVQFNDYQTLLQSQGQNAHPYAATGNAHAMLANRVSYLLNFNGPSQTIDTACSSALVAVNRALMSLRSYECSLALAGAVSLLIDPAISDAAASMGVLSPDSRCATFDETANGYVRAEGVGCVAIKRLADALRDCDSIYGIIESCAENHGGRANSLTAPNPQAQAELLLKAYIPEQADQVSYIETHGTGTGLGDPIEIDALQKAFKILVPAKQERSIFLGAVKTNIGHLEPAAGMASLLKVLLCLKYRFLPANINFSMQNKMIELKGSPFQLLTQNRPWEPPGNRVAGISCFGFGGSNVHMVVSQAPEAPFVKRVERPCWLVVLSAKSGASLARMRRQLLAYLQKSSDELADIAYTLGYGREQFHYRMSWVANSVTDLIEQISASEDAVVKKCRLMPETQTLHETDSPADWRERMRKLQDDFQQGMIIDWRDLFEVGKYRRLHLPGYVFDMRSYWFDQSADDTMMKETYYGT